MIDALVRRVIVLVMLVLLIPACGGGGGGGQIAGALGVGRFALVTNSVDSTVSVYRIDPAQGTL